MFSNGGGYVAEAITFCQEPILIPPVMWIWVSSWCKILVSCWYLGFSSPWNAQTTDLISVVKLCWKQSCPGRTKQKTKYWCWKIEILPYINRSHKQKIIREHWCNGLSVGQYGCGLIVRHFQSSSSEYFSIQFHVLPPILWLWINPDVCCLWIQEWKNRIQDSW